MINILNSRFEYDFENNSFIDDIVALNYTDTVVPIFCYLNKSNEVTVKNYSDQCELCDGVLWHDRIIYKNKILHVTCKDIIDKILSNVPMISIQLKINEIFKTLHVYGFINNKMITYDGMYIGFWYVEIVIPYHNTRLNIYESLTCVKRTPKEAGQCVYCHEFIYYSSYYEVPNELYNHVYYCDKCSTGIRNFKNKLFVKYIMIRSLLINDIGLIIIKLIIEMYENVLKLCH